LTSSVARALAGLERLAGRRLGVVALFLLALAVYAVRAVGWPLVGGRDLDEYLYGYVQFLDWHPLLPWSMLFRTPVPGIVDGTALDVAGGFFAEPLMAVLFAASVVAWTVAARAFGPRAALLVAAALLVYPAYGLMFHEVSSEPLFAAAFALWALLVVRATQTPSARRFAFVGLGIALLALIRPGNAVLIGFVVFPLILAGPRRDRLVRSGALLLAALAPLVAWAVLNGVRFDDYALARGGNAVIPFYRAFITDTIVSPENGAASRRLANAVRTHLVTRDPYKSYGVTTDEVFHSGSFRIHEDLYLLSDQVFGWDTNYSVLREAGIEAVRKHPGAYASGVLETVWQQLSESYFRTPPATQAPATPAVVDVKGEKPPAPTEGQPIPSGQSVWISRPDNCIREVWTSGTEHHFTFCKPGYKRRFDAIGRDLGDLFAGLPDRTGNAELALRLNQASRWYPRSILWILVGLVALVFRRPKAAPTLIAIALTALVVIVLNALGLFADPRFALPVAPAFVLFGSCALLARRDEP
jgi:dolichyl-phosphate-mannose-protein mannosyltransferase